MDFKDKELTQKIIGEYYADLYVGERVICELKSVEKLLKSHEVQLVN